MARKTTRALSVTEEDLKNVNEDNIELMEDFLNYLETTDKSPRSIVVYKNNLEIFFVWLSKYGKNKDFCEIKKRDFMNFQSYLTKLDLSPSRIRNLRSSLSSLSNFIENILEDEDEKWKKFRNIVNKIPAPNLVKVREKTVLEDKDCEWLLERLVAMKRYQQACAFALAWASGRRKSELLRFKVGHITDENLIFGSLYKTPEKISTKGKGKYGKLLNLYILKSKFKPYFDLWMKQRKELGVPDDIEAIFVVKKNGEWTPAKISTMDSWARIFTKFLKQDFYWHSMRHQFTTSLAKLNIPTSVIKDIIGWESIDMVDLYTDIDVDDKLGQYFGEDGIKKVESKSLSDI